MLPLLLVLSFGPATGAEPPAVAPDEVVVSVAADGAPMVDGVRVWTRATGEEGVRRAIAQQLGLMRQTRPDLQVVVRLGAGDSLEVAHLLFLGASEHVARFDVSDSAFAAVPPPDSDWPIEIPPPGEVPRPPLTIESDHHGLNAWRGASDLVVLAPAAATPTPPPPNLGLFLDEDRRLHPDARYVEVRLDPNARYADYVAIMGELWRRGYDRTVALLGPLPPPPVHEPGPGAVPFEMPRSTELLPTGDTQLSWPQGRAETLLHGDIVGYELHCAEATCDLVAQTAARRVWLGAYDERAFVLGFVFGRPLKRTLGRLGAIAPTSTGAIQMGVLVPGVESHRPGTLDKGEIEAVILAKMSGIQACFQSALDRHIRWPSDGRLAIRFVIAPDGTVPWAVTKYVAAPDERFEGCVHNVFQRMKFPAPDPEGVVIVSYPFIFGDGT